MRRDLHAAQARYFEARRAGGVHGGGGRLVRPHGSFWAAFADGRKKRDVAK
jgi:hypothetical protein